MLELVLVDDVVVGVVVVTVLVAVVVVDVVETLVVVVVVVVFREVLSIEVVVNGPSPWAFTLGNSQLIQKNNAEKARQTKITTRKGLLTLPCDFNLLRSE